VLAKVKLNYMSKASTSDIAPLLLQNKLGFGIGAEEQHDARMTSLKDLPSI
jgi:hypothetical protein